MLSIEVPFFNPNTNKVIKLCGVEYEVKKKDKIKKVCKNDADVQEVFKHVENPCFHCVQEKDAVGLLRILDKLGYKWRSGDSLETTRWEESGIYYYPNSDYKQLVCSSTFCNDNDYWILFEYKDDSLREFGIEVYREQVATVKVLANNIHEANDRAFGVDVDESSWQTLLQSNK